MARSLWETKKGQQVPGEKRLKRHNEHIQLCKKTMPEWEKSNMECLYRHYWIVNFLRYYTYKRMYSFIGNTYWSNQR